MLVEHGANLKWMSFHAIANNHWILGMSAFYSEGIEVLMALSPILWEAVRQNMRN